MIAENGEGVLGFITNHGYLDNPTFRGMRWHLLRTFDKIYVLDLHGNSKKKEVSPDGSADKNVFDIQQGVAIIIGVKKTPTVPGDKRRKGEDIPLARIFHGELWGDRKAKYQALWDGDLRTIKWTELNPQAPRFPFVVRDWDSLETYNDSFSVRELFEVGGTGVVTKRDKLTIHETKEAAWQAVNDMLHQPEAYVREKYSLPEDVRDWRYQWALDDLNNNPSTEKIQPISYRPLDNRFIYYTGRSRGFVGWPVPKIMPHFFRGENFGLATARSNKNPTPDHFFISKDMTETKFAESSTQSVVFPLYLYPAENELDQSRRVNFDERIYTKVRELAKHPSRGEPEEVAVFDYIYGVLHCPDYRETYAQFLKSDFPRIPWPVSPDVFWNVSDKGSELRRLHLMQAEFIGDTPFPFTGEGENSVEKPRFEAGKVWINETQYFDAVPDISWEFSIGGYQPAQKWLKDRKGSDLSFDDVQHYQRILKILSETDRIMKTIDMPLTEAATAVN